MNNVLIESDSEDDLPPGWEERATIDGNIYYANHTTKTTQWIHPRTGKKKYVSADLPYGWLKEIDHEGKVQFRNETTNLITHTDPRLAFAVEKKILVNEIRYTFDGSSKALQVLHGLDLSNKTAIVTGSNSGIGFEIASSLAMHGCCVIFACRSIEKANEAILKLKSKHHNVKCEPMEINLASLSSVKEFAQNFKQLNQKLDILILNAGVFGIPYISTVNGYESTFQICYLGHFYLLKLLESTILTSSFPRVVLVSSESHRFSNLTRENVNESMLSPPPSKYWSLMAYNNAKLCLVLLAFELHLRWYSKGVNVYTVHPGNIVYSGICRYWWPYKFIFTLCRPFTKCLQQAASTSVFCATSPLLSSISGYYFNNCHPCYPSEVSRDSELSKKLWLLSEKLVTKPEL